MSKNLAILTAFIIV